MTLEDLFICILAEFHVTYVCPNVYRQLELPKGFNGGGAATPGELDRLLTHVIQNLISQLGGQTRHGPRQRFAIGVFGFRSIDAQQLRLQPEVDGLTSFGFLEEEQGHDIFFLFDR